MDPRSSYYHSTRYAASHPPPPPPSHRIPANPSFYDLPPPPSYPPPASQPQFKLQNPQFSIHASSFVNPNHTVRDDYYSRSHPEHPSFPMSPRALHPGPRDSDTPRRLPEFDHYNRDSHPDFRDPLRLDSRRRSEFEQDRCGREVDVVSVFPVARDSHEVDGNSRFLGDVNGRSEHNSREKGFVDRDSVGYHHSRDQHSSSRDYMAATNHHNSSSRGFDLDLVDYERRLGLISDHGGLNENHRVIHDREVRRDVPHSMVVMGNKEVTHGDDLRTSSGKRELYNSRQANIGSEWHTDKVNREDSRGYRETSYEFKRTPKNTNHHNSSSRGVDLDLVDYERRLGLISDHGGLNENHRVIHDREVRRDVPHSMVVMGNKEVTHGDNLRTSSGKREHYNSRQANMGSQRHTDKVNRGDSRGYRETSYEFKRMPKKQPPKKSAFLRIQKPMFKNKEDQRAHFSGHYADNKSSARGEDQSSYSERVTEDEVRGKTPVELDVSFKSNSLVAKAIVTPSSTSVNASVASPRPRNSKIRKVDNSEKDSLSASYSNLNQGAMKLNSVVVKNATGPCKDHEQSSKENVRVSTTARNHSSSASGSCGNTVSVTSGEAMLDGSGKDNPPGSAVISGISSLVTVAKKRKVVKRLVKKNVKVNVDLSSSQPAKLPDEPLRAEDNDCDPPCFSGSQPAKLQDGPLRAEGCVDGSPLASGSDKSSIIESDKLFGSKCCLSGSTTLPDHCLPSSSECKNYAEVTSVETSGLQVCPKDLPVMPENDKLKTLEKAVVSDEPNFNDSFLHVSTEIGDLLLCPNDLHTRPENGKLEIVQKARVSDKSDSIENFMNDALVEVGDSQLCSNDLPVRLESSEKAMLSDKPIFYGNLVQDSPVEICDSLPCSEGLPVMPENRKLEPSEKDMVSDKPNSDENFVHDTSVEIGDSALCVNDVSVMPDCKKLESLGMDRVSDKPILCGNSMHDASVEIGDSMHCRNDSHVMSTPANETFQKAMVSDKPNSDVSYTHNALAQDMHVSVIGRVEDNLSTHWDVSDVPSTGDGCQNLGQSGVSFLHGKGQTSLPVFVSEKPHAYFDSSNSERTKIPEYPINSRNKDAYIKSSLICLQEGDFCSDISATNSPGKRDFAELPTASRKNGQNQRSNSASSLAGQCNKNFCHPNSDCVGVESVTAASAYCNHGTRTVLGSDNSSSSHEVRYDVVRQSSPDEVAMSVENSTPLCINGGSCANDGHNTPKGDVCNKNVELDALGFSRSGVADMELANERNSATTWIDTTLRLSFKDSRMEFKDSSHVGLLTRIDGTDAGESGSSTGAELDGTSPRDKKKRKISASELDLSFSIASRNEIVTSESILTAGVEVFSDSCGDPTKSKIAASFTEPLIIEDWSVSRKGFNGDTSVGLSPSQVNGRYKCASMHTPGVELFSYSCNDPSQPEDAAASLMDPLCTLDRSGSHKRFNERGISMGVSGSKFNEGARSASLPTHDVEVFSHSCIDQTKEGPVLFVDPLSASAVEMTSSPESTPTPSSVDGAFSSIKDPCMADLQSAKIWNSVLIDSHQMGGCLNTKASIDRVHHEDKMVIPRFAVPKVHNLFSGGEGRKTADASIIMNDGSFQIDSMDLEVSSGREVEPEAVEDQVVTNNESTCSRCHLPSKLPMSNEASTAVDMETDSSDLEKNNHSAVSDHPSLSVVLNDHITEIFPDAAKVLTNKESAPNHLASELHSQVANEAVTALGMETGSSYLETANLPTGSNLLSLSEDLNDQIMEILPDAISEISYPEKLTGVRETFTCQNLTGKTSTSDGITSEKLIAEGGCADHFSQNRSVVRSDQAVEGGISFLGGPQTLMPKVPRDINKQSAPSGQSCGKKHQSSNVISRTLPRSSSFVLSASRSVSHPTHNSKPRTWRRSDSSTASTLPGMEASSSIIARQWQFPKSTAGPQSTSYVRKGNSLVRKPSPVAARSERSSASDTVNDNTASDSRVDVAASSFVRAVVTNSLIERPRTPPLPIVPKVPHRSANTSVDRRSSPVVESHLGGSVRSKSNPLLVAETKDTPKSSESILGISSGLVIQTGQVKNLENRNDVNEGKVGSSTANITYVKRKSNQLVATSSLSTASIHGPCNQALSSESYYKKSKNQLVRTTLDCINPGGRNSSDGSNLEGRSVLDMKSSGGLSKIQLFKALTKIRKPSKHSLVWTLNGTQLSEDNGHALHYRRILPNLFPWKRATYRRNLPSSLSSSNISYITSKKLLLSRKHDTIYTRSKHGFSLRKSKVLSVAGSSLKWSKSIQIRSKKVNEEATLEVAAAEKRKREQNGAGDLVSGTRNRNNSPRKRVFRIGSLRYKMDPSGRTLHRISDEPLPCSGAPPMEEGKKRYVPRRLTIGKDEYVRVGSGNKLIRNPKRRSRILASEKVRWSLHTARSRLAKKRKYCQFFTRFGKCNKDDDGKCPYIHDPSKIAVCTKFLNGLCSNADCKLTHKVIPERMPDCSYFLQGLCTNKSCPYRHVNVNRSASTCEGFLKGYCADGNECGKKHSYVCQSYEATGSCPQQSKCKLHHPKNRVKGKKPKKQLCEKNKHGHGRYFGMTTHVSAAFGSGTSVLERHSSEIGDEGADFISLGFTDDEDAAGEECSNNRRDDDDDDDEQQNWSDGGEYLDGSNLDELIKPVRILNIE